MPASIGSMATSDGPMATPSPSFLLSVRAEKTFASVCGKLLYGVSVKVSTKKGWHLLFMRENSLYSCMAHTGGSCNLANQVLLICLFGRKETSLFCPVLLVVKKTCFDLIPKAEPSEEER